MRFTSFIAAVATALFVMVDPALAEDAAAAGTSTPWPLVAAGFAMAIASGLGAMSQARVCSTALEGIGRNPGAAGQMQTPMILGLVLVESLILLSFVIALKITGVF